MQGELIITAHPGEINLHYTQNSKMFVPAFVHTCDMNTNGLNGSNGLDIYPMLVYRLTSNGFKRYQTVWAYLRRRTFRPFDTISYRLQCVHRLAMVLHLNHLDRLSRLIAWGSMHVVLSRITRILYPPQPS